MYDPRLDNERPWDYGLNYDPETYRPCDAPDPDCLCDACRERRGEIEGKD